MVAQKDTFRIGRFERFGRFGTHIGRFGRFGTRIGRFGRFGDVAILNALGS